MEGVLDLTSEIKIEIATLITLIKVANQKSLVIYDDYVNNNNLVVDTKKDDSPVTQADLVVSQYLCQELKRLYPEIPIICEETRNQNYQDRKQYPYFWCIDPIDGTREFLKKNGEFTINIGLIKGTQPILGIVSCPPQDTIYFALENYGAYKLHQDKLTKISCRKPLTKPVIITSRSHSNPETEKYLSRFGDYTAISRGSSLKFLEVAEGKADYYPRLTGSMEWDTAASHIIVLEAGGEITLIDDETKTLTYNKENLLNPFFLVNYKSN